MNNKYKILVVEDDRNIRNVVRAILENNGYQVLEAANCAEADTMVMSHIPDLIVLDLGLPDGDGLSFLRRLRSDALTPVIVLSARTSEQDKVEALDLGANDYITKPFGTAEFLARIRTGLRLGRYSSTAGVLPGGQFRLLDLRIEYDSRRVFMSETEIKLTQTEYNIVALLSEHSGKVMTYSAIIKAIWGYPDSGCIKKLQVNMANIRRKLGITPGENPYIVNELGVGYRMNAE